MRKRYLQLKVFLMWLLSFSVSAQEHAHGQGKLLIAQEEHKWHLQFILPAVDILGVEYEPETGKQHLLNEVIKRFEGACEAVELAGSCKLDRVKYALPHQDHDHDHDHKKRSHKVHEEHHHSAKHEHENKHNNIEVKYFFSCGSQVEAVSVKLFNWAKSLQRIKAQWIRDNGQGMVELSRSQPFIEW